jgi:hypothetical protein
MPAPVQKASAAFKRLADVNYAVHAPLYAKIIKEEAARALV